MSPAKTRRNVSQCTDSWAKEIFITLSHWIFVLVCHTAIANWYTLVGPWGFSSFYRVHVASCDPIGRPHSYIGSVGLPWTYEPGPQAPRNPLIIIKIGLSGPVMVSGEGMGHYAARAIKRSVVIVAGFGKLNLEVGWAAHPLVHQHDVTLAGAPMLSHTRDSSMQWCLCKSRKKEWRTSVRDMEHSIFYCQVKHVPTEGLG